MKFSRAPRRHSIFGIGVLILAAFVSGCATPTRGTVSQERSFDAAPAARPVSITPETIVIDARPAFDYSTAHIPRSVPMTWSDFSEAEQAQRGIIQADTFAAARRLARAGISPTSHVVVVGPGFSGSGEEGRIAWMLAYLGVANVQFAALDSLKSRLTNEPESQLPAAAPVWKPVINESLNATKEEVLFAINERGVDKPISFKGSTARLYKLVDVRSSRAYLGKEGLGALKHVPNMDAINIPWTDFFKPDMRLSETTIQKLKTMGYSTDDRVLVIDETGVSSAAVTMALRIAGFNNAANYSGGLRDLIP